MNTYTPEPPNQELFDLIESMTGKTLVQSELSDIIRVVMKDLPASGWNFDMAAAPRDGAPILILLLNKNRHIALWDGAQWRDPRGWSFIEESIRCWQPLPPAPGETV